jgi:hypothetical protein
MTTHGSAQLRDEKPQPTNSITNNSISDAVRRRAQALIEDKSIDSNGRTWLRYALEINDPMLPELVRRADAGEPIMDDSHLEANDEVSDEEKVQRLAEMIYQAGDHSETRAAALLVLMSTLENSAQPKLLANHVKHIAFTRCGELNSYGMVDAQVAAIESELLVN